MKKMFCLIIFISLIISCNLKNNNINAIEKLASAQNNDSKVWEKIAFDEINERLDKTNIIPLKNKELDSDSIEIRVWVGFSTSPLRGLILMQTGQKWEGIYVPAINKSSNSINTPYFLPPPKSGWNNLWSKLEELEIKTLPDWTEIGVDPGYLDITAAVIEIKTSNSYRTYMSFGFSIPKELERKQVQNVAEILRILSDEFCVPIYSRSRNCNID